MALTRWDDLLQEVAAALAYVGMEVDRGGARLREVRDFCMDFQLDTVAGLPEAFADPDWQAAAEERLPELAALLRQDPTTRHALLPFPPAGPGRFPHLLYLAFALREGALDMTVVARSHRFPDRFAADLGPCLHLQERLANKLDVRRGRCVYFCLNLHQPVG